MMKLSTVLTSAVILSVTVCLLAFGSYVEITQYDPYGWAFPGGESIQSRDLYQTRKWLYIYICLAAFSCAVLLAVARILVRKRR